MKFEEHFPAGKLQIEHVTGPLYGLIRDFVFIDAKGRRHHAPKGFVFDGESIPKFWRRVVNSPWTDCPEAACIHDKYCNMANDISQAGAYFELRKDADLVYKEIHDVCVEHGISKSKIGKLKYYGVRLAGVWGAIKRIF